MKQILFRDVMREALRIFKQNSGLIISIAIFMGFFGNLIWMPWRLGLVKGVPSLMMAYALTAFLIQNLLTIGKTLIDFGLIDARPVSFRTLFSGAPYFLNVLLGSLRFGIYFLGGIILFVVPGLVYFFKSFFMSFLIIDRNISGGDALKESARITTGYKRTVLRLFALFGLVNLLSWIPYHYVAPILHAFLSKELFLSSIVFARLLLGSIYFIVTAITGLAATIAYRWIAQEQAHSAMAAAQ